jgi:hypothetical protein
MPTCSTCRFFHVDQLIREDIYFPHRTTGLFFKKVNYGKPEKTTTISDICECRRFPQVVAKSSTDTCGEHKQE